MSYRDDLEAAKERRNALARDLREVENKLARLDELKQRKRELEQDLHKTAIEMDRARSKVSLPLLSKVRVASPCNASWDAMQGDDRVRHCGQCDKNVFDLSAMTADQAEGLLRNHGTSLCVRFYRRRDGTVLTSDCPVGRKQRRKRKLAAAVLAGGLMTAGLGYLTAATSVTMGELVAPELIQGQMTIPAAEVLGRIPVPDGDGLEPAAEPQVEMLMGDVAFEPELDEPAGE